VEARCTVAPRTGACPAHCEAEEVYLFSSCAPRDLCLDALSAMLHTVLALRDAPLGAHQQPPPLTIRCPRPGCGGVFEVTISREE
jgi:uncharacterized repeat protein (TIGR04076 family)